MSETASRSFEMKAVTRAQAQHYTSFGWVQSKEPIPEDVRAKAKVKAKDRDKLVLMKRKLDFTYNSQLANIEKSYTKLEKKKFRSKPLLGIITFILMLALLLLTGVELYYGISSGLEKMKAAKPAEETTEANKKNEETPKQAALATSLLAAEKQETPKEDTKKEESAEANKEETKGGATSVLDTVKNVLDKIQNEYLSKLTGVFDGKTNAETSEYTPGIADNLAKSIGAPISYFISGATIVGLIALILAIIFIIIFAEVAKQKKKRNKKFAKMEDLEIQAQEIVDDMRRRDLSLMGKAARKSYMWETVIANALRRANGSDSDDDDY